MQACPVSYHVHDCDCHRNKAGKWVIDPACSTKHKRITASKL